MKQAIMAFLVGFLVLGVSLAQAETKAKTVFKYQGYTLEAPKEVKPMTTTSNTAINTDIKQGLVDSPKYNYPCNVFWCNVAVGQHFRWVPF